jgi:hypothetical protein
MLVAGDITPAGFAEKVSLNSLRLVTFPATSENVDVMPTIRDS